MRLVSKKWWRSMSGTVEPVFRVTALTEYQTGASPIGTRVDIGGGKISLDGNADIYASGSVTIDGSFWPDPFGSSLVAPYGNELFIEAGLRYRDDLVELVGLGYYRIKRTGQERAASGGPIEIDLQDRMAGIARDKFLFPETLTASTTYGQAVEAIVTSVYPEAVIVWDDDVEDQPLGRDILLEQGKLPPLQSIALSAGKVMRWNELGQLTLFSIPNLLDTNPVARLSGRRNGVLVEASRELNDEDVVNVVIARGEGADQVGGAYGIAYDLDPLSPTRYDGPFGPAPLPITSATITSNDIGNIAAAAELNRRRGLPSTISFEIAPNYALEPDDLVFVEHTNANGRHLISSLDIPLSLGQAMTGTTRQQLFAFRGN